MRAMVTKGGFYTWINTRENQFIEEHFSNNEMNHMDNLVGNQNNGMPSYEIAHYSKPDNLQ